MTTNLNQCVLAALLSTLMMSVFAENQQQRYLAIHHDGEVMDLRFWANQEQAASLRQRLQNKLSEQSLWWSHWRETHRLPLQINQALAQQQGVLLSASVEVYLRQLKQLAEQSSHYYNPTLEVLLTSPNQLQANTLPINFAQIQFIPEGLFSRNPNVRLNFSITQQAYVTDFLQDLIEDTQVSEASLEYGNSVVYLGTSNHSFVLPSKELTELVLCQGQALHYRQGQSHQVAWQGRTYHAVKSGTDKPVSLVAVIADNAIFAAAASYALLAAGDSWNEVVDSMALDEYLIVSPNRQIISPAVAHKNQQKAKQQAACLIGPIKP